MMISITAFYTALLALIFVGLSFRTISLRNKHKVAIGHDQVSSLERAIRAHGNFSEYTPLALLLIYFVELNTDSYLMIHMLCISFLLGRIIHAININKTKENLNLRVVGMVLSLGVIIIAAIYILYVSFSKMI